MFEQWCFHRGSDGYRVGLVVEVRSVLGSAVRLNGGHGSSGLVF